MKYGWRRRGVINSAHSPMVTGQMIYNGLLMDMFLYTSMIYLSLFIHILVGTRLLIKKENQKNTSPPHFSFQIPFFRVKFIRQQRFIFICRIIAFKIYSVCYSYDICVTLKENRWKTFCDINIKRIYKLFCIIFRNSCNMCSCICSSMCMGMGIYCRNMKWVLVIRK